MFDWRLYKILYWSYCSKYNSSILSFKKKKNSSILKTINCQLLWIHSTYWMSFFKTIAQKIAKGNNFHIYISLSFSFITPMWICILRAYSSSSFGHKWPAWLHLWIWTKDNNWHLSAIPKRMKYNTSQFNDVGPFREKLDAGATSPFQPRESKGGNHKPLLMFLYHQDSVV